MKEFKGKGVEDMTKEELAEIKEAELEAIAIDLQVDAYLEEQREKRVKAKPIIDEFEE